MFVLFLAVDYVCLSNINSYLNIQYIYGRSYAYYNKHVLHIIFLLFYVYYNNYLSYYATFYFWISKPKLVINSFKEPSK